MTDQRSRTEAAASPSSWGAPDGGEEPVRRPLAAADLGEAARRFVEHPSARILATQTALLALARAGLGRPRAREMAIAVGVAAWWPIQEWLAHRYILHAEPRRVGDRTVDLGVARVHRRHHADPWNPTYAFLPTWFLGPAVPVHATLWALATRERRAAVTGMAATSAATLIYEWTHFLTHTAYKPRRSWFRRLQRRHRLHHFKHEQRWYGFTVPYVDDALGTAPDPATVETSPTVRTLGLREAA